jgi:hypothetical protein
LGEEKLTVRRLCAVLVTIALTTPLVCVGSETERAATQAKLDAECEAARQQVLAPQREKYVAECVENKQKESVEDCERFYRDYGERSGHVPALYYNLKECEAALDYRQSYRQ